MQYSPLDLQSVGISLGSTIATGQMIWTGRYVKIESVGQTCVFSGVSTNDPNTFNASYLNGLSVAHPFSLSIPLNTVQLYSGACNLVHG